MATTIEPQTDITSLLQRPELAERHTCRTYEITVEDYAASAVRYAAQTGRDQEEVSREFHRAARYAAGLTCPTCAQIYEQERAKG